MGEDPDGFDQARRRDTFLRLAAIQGKHSRDALAATLTPLELAQHDLESFTEFVRSYRAGETSFPINESNTAAADELLEQLRARVDELRGS